MCCDNLEELLDQLNPTFLFTWKGTRLKDEELYHSHDFIEMAFILSGVAFRAKCKIFSRHLQKPILKTEKGRFKGL